ncbi:hypothetical protein [Arthrobacter sp. NPDC090010]|uniref:hypothetical protein n=1 Tax=Arthrobacter sp. NPDC090010 TaxID=3363942 RepID=UPI003813EEC5
MPENLRHEFIDWLKTRRTDLVRGSSEDSADALECLGLDDATLAAARSASKIVLSTPHASPNVFGQRMRVGWAAAAMQGFLPEVHHIRVVLTHTNMSDLGWRPYAWWTLDVDNQLQVTKIFSRNKKRKHTVLCTLPTLELDPLDFSGTDASAAKRARVGSDLSRSLMLLMASIERAAGLALPERTCYIPLDLVLEFVRELGDRNPAFDHMLRRAHGRKPNPEGRLVPAGRAQSLVFDNASNLASLAIFGAPVLLGGAKMLGYWSEVASASRLLGGEVRPVRPFLIPELDLSALFPLRAELSAALNAAGIEYSQGMATSEYGQFAHMRKVFDPLLLDRLSALLTDR